MTTHISSRNQSAITKRKKFWDIVQLWAAFLGDIIKKKDGVIITLKGQFHEKV
jgi:hypothetical protein